MGSRSPTPDETSGFKTCIILMAIPIGLIGICVLVMFGPFLWSLVRYYPLRLETFRDVIRPTAQWVHSYQDENGRLPTNDELVIFARTNSMKRGVWIYDSPPTSEAIYQTWRNGTDFMITVSVADWRLFYNSWDHKEEAIWMD